MSDLTVAVRNALAHQDMVAAATNVKQLLCDELARVDPTAAIHRTEYFNHTYLPDVVLDWDAAAPREVFLRFASAPGRLLADVDGIGASGPVIFDLSHASGQREVDDCASASSAVQQASERSARLLITDSEATQHVRPHDAENIVERIVVGNLLRSGRGNLDEPAAQNAVRASRAGYVGAIATEPDEVREVVAVAEELFGTETKRRVERTLQMLWWVGGGAPEEFPIGVLDDMELNPFDARDFLRDAFSDEPIIEDDAFWSRLADRLSFNTLVDVGDVTNSENLRRLMSQLAGRLKLSHVILDKRERPLPPFDQLAWGLEHRFLCLRGPEWACRFTPDGNRFSQRRDEGRPVPLVEVDLRSADYLIEEVEIDEAARQVVVSRKTVDPAQRLGPSLRDLAVGFADDAAVRTISVLLGDSLMKADFHRMMVGADPDVTVRSMAAVATRLLAALDDDAEAELAGFLGN